MHRIYSYPWGVRVAGRNRLLRPLVSVWEARFDEMAPAQHVLVGRSEKPGVRLLTTRFHEWALVYTFTSSEKDVLDQIEAAGGVVARDVIHVRKDDPRKLYNSQGR